MHPKSVQAFISSEQSPITFICSFYVNFHPCLCVDKFTLIKSTSIFSQLKSRLTDDTNFFHPNASYRSFFNVTLKKQLSNNVSRFYPHLEKLVYQVPFSLLIIFFKYKGGQYGSTYIWKCVCNFATRPAQSKGKSVCTGLGITVPGESIDSWTLWCYTLCIL